MFKLSLSHYVVYTSCLLFLRFPNYRFDSTRQRKSSLFILSIRSALYNILPLLSKEICHCQCTGAAAYALPERFHCSIGTLSPRLVLPQGRLTCDWSAASAAAVDTAQPSGADSTVLRNCDVLLSSVRSVRFPAGSIDLESKPCIHFVVVRILT